MTRKTMFAGLALALVAALGVACDRSAPEGAGSGEAPKAAVAAGGHSHSEAGTTCFICDPSKRDPDRLWCKGHDRYEDRCWDCHPELRDPDRLYCEEHGLYEDECFLCDPARAGGDASNGAPSARLASDASAPDRLYCNEHGLYEDECGTCHPDLAAGLDVGGSMKIRFASAEGPRKAGVSTAPARGATSGGTVEALAETHLNGNRMARITPLTGGVVTRVMVDVGDAVEVGTPLVDVHSAEVADAKAAYLSAVVTGDLAGETLRRETSLRERGVSSEEDFLEAEAEARRARIASATARQRLLNLGLTEEQVNRVRETEDASATITLRAPFAGEIVERAAVVGEAASPGRPLLTIADLGTVWIELSLPASAAGGLSTGALVEATFDAMAGETFEAELTWIDAKINHRSRMVRARAVADNADRRLRAGLFGEAWVTVERPGEVVRVPRDAVQHVSGEPFVFVRSGADLFEARRVALASMDDRQADIVGGLEAGEPVVVTGSFTVMSEMLKGRLGAGCVHN